MDEKQRREFIQKFISQNQGCTFDDIAEGVKDKISRMTAHHTVADLVKEGIVKDDKLNRRDHRYFVDSNNPIVEISRELDEFENAYISLLEKVKEHLNIRYCKLKKGDYSSTETGGKYPVVDKVTEFWYAEDLISQSVHIFSEVLKMYMVRSVTLWSTMIKDQTLLDLLNSALSAKLSDIQNRMDNIFRSITIVREGVSTSDNMLNTAAGLRDSLKKFDSIGIKKESKELSRFVRYLVGFDLIRGADYAKTSKYKWDITQTDKECVEETVEKINDVVEDYENPFLDDD